MKSTIILYERCDIEKEKLFIVDNLSAYLASLSKVTISDFQYIRQDLLTSIKLNMSQTSINPSSLNNYNYLSIQNGTEKVFYYFIDKKTQVAKDTILFTLSLDTINTFKLNVDFYITDKTIINRMHKDRFYEVPNSSSVMTITISDEGETRRVSSVIYRNTHVFIDTEYVGYSVLEYNLSTNNTNVGVVSCIINSDGDLIITCQSTSAEQYSLYGTIKIRTPSRYLRKIDKISEGVSPILFGKDLGYLIEKDNPDNSYLVYKGSQNINCMLTFDNEKDVLIGAKDALDPSDFTTNTYYYFMCDTNGTPEAIFYRVVGGYEYEEQSLYKAGYYRHCVVLRTDGTNIFLGYIVYTYLPQAGGWVRWKYMEPIDIGTQVKVVSNSPSLRAFKGASWTMDEVTIYALPQESLALTTSQEHIRSISSLNRSDSELIKIIKLPYSVVNLSRVDTKWGYNATDHMLQYINLDQKLVNNITIDEDSVHNPLNDLNIDLSSISLLTLKNDIYESKLFHSDYYQPKFVYDSFSKVFALERIDLASYTLVEDTPFEFNFMASNTITSKFLFQFPQYITDGYMMEDFDNIIAVDRNNEMTIYSSDYLQYIKTGFNYDIKKKNREALVGGATTALAIVGSVASFIAAGAHPILSVAGISLATTAMTKLISTANTTIQAEATQNQKLEQLRKQKDSVYNTDAVDLLDYYCQNKAKLMVYSLGENVKKAMFDLFFYTGYLCGYRGTPDFTSRIRFNFVSCDLDFDMGKTGSRYINKDILDDIYSKFSAGVTNIHHFNSQWDFEQKYENWETFLFS